MNSRRIIVRGCVSGTSFGDLLPLIQALFEVEFEIAPAEEAGTTNGIVFEEMRKQVGVSDRPAVSSFRFDFGEQPLNGGELMEVEVCFAEDPDVPFPFQGRRIRLKVAGPARRLVIEAGEKSLAVTEAGPVWLMSRFGDARHYRSAWVLPAIPPEGTLHDVLNGGRFLEILPFLHWLREPVTASGEVGPKLRACFLFDDPNLHWPRYGFVDFKQIAVEAARENFHVSFATVPFDAWYTNGAAAKIFRNHAERISFLIHGNNHTYRELAGCYTAEGRLALLEQAIARIERLEQKTGIKVARVMAAPHGACSEEMLRDLPRCGFEGATISHGSLRAHNATKDWTRSLGYLPAELVYGCTVLPRWGMSLKSKNSILLAAYLHQPIILIGHQMDLREGIGLLNELARFINGLGPVQWLNFTHLFRTSYCYRTEGGICRVKPLTCKITLRSTRPVERLIVEPVSSAGWTKWRVSFPKGPGLEAISGEPILLPEGFGDPVALEAILQPNGPKGAGSPRVPVRDALRRLLVEGRDRVTGQLLPFVRL